MKRILSTAFAAVLAIGLNGAMISDAEAKRLGGGSSSGMKRDSSIMQRSTTPPQNTTAPTQTAKPAPAAAPTAGAPAPSGMSRWMGPIAGLAAGLGIAALLSHFGMGEGVANFVMIALLVMAAFFVFRLIFGRKKEAPNGMQYAGAGNTPRHNDTMQFNAGYEATNSTPAAAGAENVGEIPADFDAPGFLRQAKLNFVRLQAANDRGDMADISNFTSPELFAEIQMQYQERGRSTQQTDVVQLEADLLDVSVEGSSEIASVRFHGQIRETANAAPEGFNEVWHLARPRDGSKGWVIAGIQQAE
jgi:predicted lipid-binding transport protein (Tim44 family)